MPTLFADFGAGSPRDFLPDNLNYQSDTDRVLMNSLCVFHIHRVLVDPSLFDFYL